MKFKHAAIIAGFATLAAVAPVQAQMTAEQAPQAEEVTPATDVSAEEIDKFANVVIGIETMRAQKGETAPQQQQQAVVALLQENELTPLRFRQIAQAAQTDEQLRARVQERVTAIVQAG